MDFAYCLASDHNASIVLPAHPKKVDKKYEVKLEDDPELYVEQIMGTSHFINSTGSIWALSRTDELSLFYGGRQRGEGHASYCYITLDDKNRLQLIDDSTSQARLVLKNPQWQQAWDLLPDTFRYRQGEELVKPAMSSTSTYNRFIKKCKQARLLVQDTQRIYFKAGKLN